MADSQVLNAAGVSEREAEVLTRLGLHRTNAEIAAELFISVRTVESHVSALLRKLQVADRRALAELAATFESLPDEPRPPERRPRLPSPLTSFVGRNAERAALADALTQHRLVTAVGPGGVGKTRLALALAADLANRYAGGAWYVDLVPVTDPAMVGAAVAAALGFAEQPGRSPTDTVIALLDSSEALLVLDNCEHLIDGVVAFVERLLTACPDVVVLATSQARLVVPYEWVYQVPGLSTGSADDYEGDAVALFIDRAAMAGWSPESPDDRRRVATVCDRLEGSALAIELAAARLATVGLDGLEGGLADQLTLLEGGPRAHERHRSVRSALAWSYGLLDDVDQTVARRASVFAAPFTADAAAIVVSDAKLEPSAVAPALARLADHSLLVVESHRSGTRYRMLESIRQYGAEELDTRNELEDIRGRHLAWCRDVAAQLGAETEVGASFDAVADDLRAALGWAAKRGELRTDAYDLAERLAELSFLRGLPSEAQRRYEQAGALAADAATSARALHMGAAAAFCRFLGDDSVRLYLVAADILLEAGDRRGAALEIARAAELVNRSPGLMSEIRPDDEAEGLLARARTLAGDDPHVQAGILAADFGGEETDPVTAEVVERAVVLAQRVHDPRLESAALDQLTVVQLARGELLEAAASARRRVDLLTELRLDAEIAMELEDALHMAPMTIIGAGNLIEGRRLAEQRVALPFHQVEGQLTVDWLLVVSALAGDWDDAVELGERFVASWVEGGRLPLGGFAAAPAAAAMVHGIRGDDEGRQRWLSILDEMRRVVAHLAGRTTGYGPTFDGMVALHRGDFDGAMTALADEPEALKRWHAAVWRQWYAAAWAEAGVLARDSSRASRLDRARFLTVGNPIATAMVDRAEGIEDGDHAKLLGAAAALEAEGSRYQQARTLVFAGGDERVQGEALLRAMGAVPMAGIDEYRP